MNDTYNTYAPEVVAPPMPVGLFELTDEDDGPDIFDLPEGLTAKEAAQLDREIQETDEPEEPIDERDYGSVELRPYQLENVRAVLKEFKDGVKSTLTVAATGTGKSVVIAEIARQAASREHGVLILVHRDELIRQIVRHCGRVSIHALVEKANERARPGFGVFSKVVCASVQSMRGERLAVWKPDDFKLIIIDEAHHAVATTYQNIIAHFSGARRCGFTATADRLDGGNIGSTFETLAYEFNLRDAINGGWLVPVEAMQLTTDPKIDLKNLRVTAGDFNLGDLDKVIQENIGTLVNAIKDTNALEERRSIAFTPDIGSAQALALALDDIGITARHVAGNSPDRREILEAHQRGDFQVLTNCMIATEGYDDPQIEAVVICRPTKSRGLYSQMVGRSTRRFPQHLVPSHPDAKKKNCRIVDFAYLTGRHKLVCAVDLFDNANVPDEVVNRARDLVQNEGERDVDKALEQARMEFDERIRVRRRQVQVKAGMFDPVGARELFGIPAHKENYEFGDVRPATPKMVEALRKWGISCQDDIGFGEAHQLLNRVFGRNDHGWTSPRTVAKLMEAGIDPDTAAAMRETEAREYLDAHPLGPTLKQAKWLRWQGVSESIVSGMTRKQASERISAIKDNG